MVAINERRYLGEVIPNYIESEAKLVPTTGVNGKYWFVTLDEVPGTRPEVPSNVLVSTNSTFTNLLRQVSGKAPSEGEYAISGQDIFVNSIYAGTILYFRYYGVGSIVKQQDLDALDGRIVRLEGGRVIPSGSIGDIQFNNDDALGSNPALNWTDSAKRLTFGSGAVIRMTDGAGAGKILVSDVNGDLTLQAFAGIPSGSDRQIQFNDSGSFGASANLTFTAGNKLVLAGTIQITGGVPGASKVLTSDASGNATWEDSAANPGGVNGDIQFKNGTAFAGDSEINFDSGTKRLTFGTNAIIRITGGTPALGKVLTSDANGDASWQNALGYSPGGAYRVPFADSGGTNLTDSPNIFYNSTNVGLQASRFFSDQYKSTTNDSILTFTKPASYSEIVIGAANCQILTLESRAGSAGQIYFPGGNVGFGVTPLSTDARVTIRNWVGQITPSLQIESDAGTPLLTVDETGGLYWGDGDTGFYESSSNVLRVKTGGTDRFFYSSSLFASDFVGGGGIANEQASSTNPTLLPWRADDNTGIGADGSDTLSLITGGVSAMTIDASQNINLPQANQVIQFQGNRFIHNFSHPTGDTAIPLGFNTFIGEDSGNLSVGSTATNAAHASFNVGLGSYALFSLTTGFNNVGVGAYAGYNLDVGAGNVCIGMSAGRFVGSVGSGSAASSSNGVFIGQNATPLTSGSTEEIVIGRNTVGNGSFTVTLGSDSTTATYLKGIINISGDLLWGGDTGFTESSDIIKVKHLGIDYWSFDAGRFISLTAGGPQLRRDVGSATSPTYAFFGDEDNGMYRVSANVLGFTTAGVQALEIDDTQNINLPQANQVIQFQGNRFIHNFSHPTGDTAIPAGRNTFIGELSGNFSMGSTAVSTAQASDNAGIGALTLSSLTTGSHNFAAGYASLYSANSGVRNVALGGYSLYSLTTTGYNVAIGYQCARYYNTGGGDTALQTPQFCTYVGSAIVSGAASPSREIIIGYNAMGNGTNTTTIGDSNNTKTFLFGDIGINVDPQYEFHLEKSNSGSPVEMRIRNQSNTAGSATKIFIATAGATAGDPIITFNNNVINWSMGLDNSDGDSFKIVNDSSLSANDFVLTTAGYVGIKSDPTYHLDIQESTTTATYARIYNSNGTGTLTGLMLQNSESSWRLELDTVDGVFWIWDDTNNNPIITLNKVNPANYPYPFYMDGQGDIGMGISTPAARIDIWNPDNSAMLIMRNSTGTARWTFDNTGRATLNCAAEAFNFTGSEVISSAVGGSQDKKLHVNVSGVDYYIPLHTA